MTVPSDETSAVHGPAGAVSPNAAATPATESAAAPPVGRQPMTSVRAEIWARGLGARPIRLWDDSPSVDEDAQAADDIEHERKGPLKSRVSVAMTLWLLLVWIAVFSSVQPLVLLSGVVLGVLIQIIFPLPLQRRLWHVRIGAFLILALRFVWDLIVAGAQVSWLVVTGKQHEDGIVRCPTLSGNPVYMTILAAMSSMIPGTIVVKVEPFEKVMYLHVLDLKAHGGVQGVKKEVEDQEKRILLGLTPDDVLRETGLRTVGIRVRDAFSGGGSA